MEDLYQGIEIGTELRGKKPQRNFLDRRSDQDRRQTYHLDFLDVVGFERRKFGSERRQVLEEHRTDWVRVTSWVSVCVNENGLYY